MLRLRYMHTHYFKPACVDLYTYLLLHCMHITDDVYSYVCMHTLPHACMVTHMYDFTAMPACMKIDTYLLLHLIHSIYTCKVVCACVHTWRQGLFSANSEVVCVNHTPPAVGTGSESAAPRGSHQARGNEAQQGGVFGADVLWDVGDCMDGAKRHLGVGDWLRQGPSQASKALQPYPRSPAGTYLTARLFDCLPRSKPPWSEASIVARDVLRRQGPPASFSLSSRYLSDCPTACLKGVSSDRNPTL